MPVPDNPSGGAVSAGPVTADELLAMSEGCRELVRGEVIEMTPAGETHGDVEFNILLALGHFVKRHKLGKVYPGDTGFLLESDPDTVRAPDVAFVRRDRLVRTRKYFPGAPDLAVEVISPNDTPSELADRADMWLAHGTQEVWVVDPSRRTLKVHRAGQATRILTEQDDLSGGDLVPGFNLAVGEIFPSIE